MFSRNNKEEPLTTAVGFTGKYPFCCPYDSVKALQETQNTLTDT